MRPLLAILVVVFLVPNTAVGEETLCTERSNVLRDLRSEYAEMPRAMGIANNGGVMELLASPHGRSWTFIITMPDGITCMIAAGEHWTELEPPPKGPKT